ncbi:hypothetical protein OG618_36035 [Kitasatospora sp. NBC_01246]|uniref:hypothetical protein n=1 Tax=Kitasatospora sp. NBC_01246 TaxID=2903570 RepID=UPI002E309851|nr:hypothetical protein [Kitasatospora sp. NBC_01246]
MALDLPEKITFRHALALTPTQVGLNTRATRIATEVPAPLRAPDAIVEAGAGTNRGDQVSAGDCAPSTGADSTSLNTVGRAAVGLPARQGTMVRRLTVETSTRSDSYSVARVKITTRQPEPSRQP